MGRVGDAMDDEFSKQFNTKKVGITGFNPYIDDAHAGASL
tara:strand:+ start:208 stop:327 length:120 start_codon:yes stop_codon:yes gene_type:complete